MVTVQDDLMHNYEQAKQLVVALEEVWEAEDRPLLTLGGATGKSLVEHPLVKLLQVARRDVDRLAKGVQVRHRGPAPQAVVVARIGKAPSAGSRKLRAAKSA